MRFIVDVLVGLMLIGILGAVILHRGDPRVYSSEREITQQDVRRFQRQIHLQTVLESEGQRLREFPMTIRPEWFGEELPRNALLSKTHPWLEIADEQERDHRHPPMPIALDESYAAFWYNPYQGIVRARAPGGLNDELTLELYNEVNGVDLKNLLDATN